MNPELLKLLQGTGVAILYYIVQYFSNGHPTLLGAIGLIIATRVAGYGASKLPTASSAFQTPRGG